MSLIIFIGLIGYCCHDEINGFVFPSDILRSFIYANCPVWNLTGELLFLWFA